MACELMLLHHSNQSWLYLKVVCFNGKLSHSIILFLNYWPPKFFHCVRLLRSLCFFFLFWNSLQSFYLISHLFIFNNGSFPQILQGSFNFSIQRQQLCFWFSMHLLILENGNTLRSNGVSGKKNYISSIPDNDTKNLLDQNYQTLYIYIYIYTHTNLCYYY